MVTFLVEHNASINQPDNEGWIPLHAAASCGYMDIAEYLISQGANVGVVNSEGETPLDIAEEEAMEELLQNEINRQGVDIEAARKEEERVMLRDARQWLNSGQIQDVRHIKSGGTALHVAAAKGYVEVLKLLIQAGYDVNIKDYDGWTSLHAAAHWGKEEACRILVENRCDMDLINKVGQTAFDVSDEDVLGYLEELHKKQDQLSSDKKDVKKSPLIETTTTGDNNQSLKPPKSEKTVLLEPEKIAPPMEKRPRPPALHPTNQVTTPTSPVKKVPVQPAAKVSPRVTDEDRKDESPSSWRLGLRKTGSYGALAEITATKEAQKEKDAAGDKDKEKDKSTRLAYVAPTFPRRLASTSDIEEKENRDSASLARSGSYTRRRWDDDLKNTPSYQRSTSHTLALGRSGSTRDVPSKSWSTSSLEPNASNTKPWQSSYSIYRSGSFGRRLLSSLGSSSTRPSLTSRYWSEESTDREKEKEERRRSYLTPGVTLTDLQEAEKTIGKGREDDYRSRYRSFEEGYGERRSTGVSFWTQESDENDPDQHWDSEEGSTKGEPQSDRLSRNESSTSYDGNDSLGSYGEGRRPSSCRLDRDDNTDYKKLYEQILAENEKLKAQLRDTDLELAHLKLQLEKATQRQERYADRSQLEMEKRERRALERKISEMEEELKTLPDLKADNQRLKDENGALIRVISKLSK
ncbi:hypothetical protein NHX12_020573 [Muraenolepis orangiensis]|uniref:Protein phosphatase 1 regulatory subunit 12A n=1 Tax=Muraenolepis orangiensis TaxID=630683 RepID=A0A9Q0IT54_9TELE|nr:hypothetical protein NHX12_020573 [Muraenolepis orangiensis]